VIDDVEQRGRPATVVLVSDSIETCGGDALSELLDDQQAAACTFPSPTPSSSPRR
jgi:hypothetical protein